MIHSTALVDSDLPDDAEVGPYAVVGPEVTLGPGCSIGPNAVVMGPTHIEGGVKIGPCAVVGTDPQDMKYSGERTTLQIGEGTVIREFANLNRGTAATGSTVVGKNCLVMAYVHVAHDCRIGDNVVLANAVNLAGHVRIGDHARVGGVVPVHQFVRIGAHSMIGGGYRVSKDVPPFALAGGYPLRVVSMNKIGLRRDGFAPERIDLLRKAFNRLFRSEGVLSEKASVILEEGGWGEDSEALARFVLSSERGVII